ncbi:MAG: SRPBCC domain-containing protein [Acidimicrobiales bacterium]
MTGPTAGSGRILGSLRVDGTGIVRVEDRFDSDIDDVWSAITDPRRLARWHVKVRGDLHAGGEIHLHVEADDWEGTGHIEVCEAPRRLLVTTRESDESWRKGQGVPPFDETLEATLDEVGAKTRLVIEVRGIPLDPLPFYGVGWQIHLENLASYLAGRDRGDTEARWEELIPSYQALAADIGK